MLSKFSIGSVSWRWLGLVALLFGGSVHAQAVTRTIHIAAPSQIVAGSTVTIPVHVSTDAGKGETIGFFHGDVSVDGGATWKAFTADQRLAASATREVKFTAGAPGSVVKIRVRVAFRGGAAGDVDHLGKPIQWEKSWANWETPSTRVATIKVVAK